ncbi:DUF3558 domain-containing protein [Streptomyces sp. NPDC052051]|uniref:DUF3558 domain-containing protein n=1 Tax=Streptomyces sp. NPDC052051 TaxID=3154649 RepID=UPI0034217D79
MQRKAYVPGAVVLLAALLAACTGSGDDNSATDGSQSGGSAASAAEPGKYHTLADACAAVSHGTLDSLLPGIKEIADPEQRDRVYEGEADLTYNNDRRSGCRWKAESTGVTDHLRVDFERVVSYDTTVSDDSRAEEVFAGKAKAADIPLPSGSSSASADHDSASPTEGKESASPTPSGSSSAAASGTPSATDTPMDLQPRALDDLGDEAFLDDRSGTARQRSVTVAFRTSNVIVTIEYDEQPTAAAAAPTSEEMQDKAQKLAHRLAGSLG